MLKNLWVIIFLVLFGCSNRGFDTVTSFKLTQFDKKEVALEQKISIEEDGVYTVSIRFYEQKNDETGMGLMSMLGFHLDGINSLVDSGVPIDTYFEIIDSNGSKISQNVKSRPTTFAVGDGRVAYLGKAYLKTGNYKMLFYVRQKNPIFAKTSAVLNIGNVPLGK